MKATQKAVGIIALGLAACQGSDSTPAGDRQSQVAAIGATVMPFDLEATTHVFEKTADGGVQQVVADEGAPDQIDLIREHLRSEATRFAAGDFHDPAMIHGADMAGLHELVMGHEKLVVDYQSIGNGGQIRYSSEDDRIVTALHAWFDAQLADHGSHAQAHR